MLQMEPAPAALDEVLGAFASSFGVSSEPNRVEAPHPRFCQYKNKRKTDEENQDERRAKRLKLQKECVGLIASTYPCITQSVYLSRKRFDLLQQLRGSTGDDEESTQSDDSRPEIDDIGIAMEADLNSSSDSVVTKKQRKYKNALMMSEWMVSSINSFQLTN